MRVPKAFPPAAGPAPRPAAAELLALLLPALLLALLLPLLVACAAQRDVISEDAEAHREVAILTGVKAPATPADPRFAQLTVLQAEGSLRRLIVKPSGVIAFSRGDPKPFLTPEDVLWARDAVASALPKLGPQQRLQLRFRDRFNQFNVEVELYGEGSELVYRFTKLAANPDPTPMNETRGKPLNYVELVAQPGQRYDYDVYAYYLRDGLFNQPEGAPSAEALTAMQDELRARVSAGKLSNEDVAPVEGLLRTQAPITLDTLKLYLDKLETVLSAQRQGLFSADEAAARRQKLLDELRPHAQPAPAPTR
jgi:hypothetical protein